MASAIAAVPTAIEPDWAPAGRQVTPKGTATAMLASLNNVFDAIITSRSAIKGDTAKEPDTLGSVWNVAAIVVYIDNHMAAAKNPGSSIRVVNSTFPKICCELGIVVRLTPVLSASGVAAALSTALHNVAHAAASAPGDSMAAVASAYDSYARRIAEDVANGILATTLPQVPGSSVFLPTVSVPPPSSKSPSSIRVDQEV